jgi:allophanate hydrolase
MCGQVGRWRRGSPLRAQASYIRRSMDALKSLLIADLLREYRAGRLTPRQLIEHVVTCMERAASRNVWISRLSREWLLERAATLEGRSADELPLYGIPFVIKDNIDLTGVPTSAGCAEYSYIPERSAVAVQKLLDAGAIPLGKTNLDQFATGLVGTRSPYGACLNSFDSAYISGGSSSGSAVAVATGLASFALGTDTAGSGRVPAAFNNIIGLKPSCGRVSTRGVVPACRSLDCVSIFSLTCADAARVLSVIEGFDAADPYSRALPDNPLRGRRFGIPGRDQLQFFGDREYARLFDHAVERVASVGGAVAEIDFAPFLEAARLLYEGPWVAERYLAIQDFIERHSDAMHPVTREIIMAGKSSSAAELFKAQHRLMSLRRATAEIWNRVDVIMTPTSGTIYERASVEAAPLQLNANLGYYTNFMNLLDLAGVAVPAGFREDGLPFGVTLVAPRATDYALLDLADGLHRSLVIRLGALSWSIPPVVEKPARAACEVIEIAVCGAHMDGLPLNQQLRDAGGSFVCRTRTRASYKLYALPGGPPQRPGLLRVREGGASIAVEVWAIKSEAFAGLVGAVPAPLAIGKIELEDGERVSGFLCEACGLEEAVDITGFGGWRSYLEHSLRTA